MMRRTGLILVVIAALGSAALAALWAASEPRFINTVVRFEAPPSVVWPALAATGRYPEWNPLITAFDGRLATGETVAITLRLPDSEPYRFDAYLLGVQDGYEIRWEAALPIPKMLEVKYKLIMTPSATGGTTLRHEGEFRGLLVGPLTAALLARFRAGMEAMNRALSSRLAAG